MQVNASIFKAYDIRGIYPEQLSAPVAYALGRAFATLLQRENVGQQLTVLVGYDMRLSGPELKAEVIRGITETGVAVVDAGLVSTPTFYYAVAKHGLSGGVQVSASHNPAEYNGMKMVRRGGAPIGGSTGILDMLAMIQNDDYAPLATTPAAITTLEGATAEEATDIVPMVDVKAIKPMKVVLDTANAMGGPDMRALFAHLPQLQVTYMNEHLDGTFPAHEADPFKDENTADLRARVVAEGADLGISIDGDGDRIFFIDEKGESVPPSILRGLMAKVELLEHPGETVAYDIRPGRITRDMIEELGGRAVVTRVGHSLIKETMLKENAIFGGESSGHFFYRLPVGTFEIPMLLTLKLMRYLTEQSLPFSEIVAPLKRYAHSGEINTHLPDRAAVELKVAAIQTKYSGGQQNLLDGVTVEYEDVWFNVRASNTEPLIRLTVEARTKEKMEAKRDEILALIRS